MGDVMKGKPIIFSAPMVRALRAGTKTQTRRLLPQPNFEADGCHNAQMGGRNNWWDYWKLGQMEIKRFRLPYAPGDRLWVREAWRAEHRFNDMPPRDIPPGENIQYLADDPISPWDARYRYARFMPRWASRMTPTVTDVRVQRLQEISGADAVAEGCGGYVTRDGEDGLSPQEQYRDLWNTIHGADAWAANPWVRAVTFTVAHCNIDQMEGGANA